MERLKTAPAPALREPVSVCWVSNILDPLASRKQSTVAPGTSLGVVLAQFVPMAPQDFEVTAVLNGELLPVARHDIILLSGDNLVMAARPQGGGGGGSNALATIAMLAVVVVAAAVTYGVSSLFTEAGLSFGLGLAPGAGYAGCIAGGLAGMGVMALGGQLVSSAFKAKSPDFGGGGQDALGSSPSYSWQAQGNPLAEGTTLPVLYGRFMVTPPLIARHIESAGTKQYLNLLYALAGHKIDAVEKVLINDQVYTSYNSATLDVRYGSPDQSVIPYFNDLKEEISIGAKLSTAWTQREFSGSLQGFAVGLAYSLYYANDKGGMDNVTAKVQLEYRRKGQTAWTRFTSKNATSVTITKQRWSAGYYSMLGGLHWVELLAGSSVADEHYAHEPYYPPGWTAVQRDREKGVAPRVSYYWRWASVEVVYAPGTITYDYLTLTGNDANQHRHVVYADHITTGEYEVRARLASALTVSSRHGSDVYWDFAHMIQYDDFTYPCTALAGIRALATDQISSGQPVVKFLIRRDYVYVYDANAKKYVQKSACNPAWASYDALHNGASGHPDPSAYGMGVPHSKIIYNDFLDWATWCDKKGYTVNIYIESPLDGKATLDMLGTMGRGTVIQIGSRFTCTVDKPCDLPKQTFLVGLGNIVSQTLTKEWLPMQDRANVVELTYFDKSADYQRQVVEVYQDGFDSSSRAVIKAQRTLYGCDTRAAALTFGSGLMLRNRYLTYMPSFETSVESIHCLPGDPIDLAIDTLQGGASGRLLAADYGSLTIDYAVTMLPGVQYACELQHIDTDARDYAYIVGVTQQEETDVLTLLKPLAKVPQPGSKFAFGEVGRTKQTFRVMSMQTASDQRRRLQLLEYVPELYDDSATYVPEEDAGIALAFVRDLRATEIWLASGKDGSGHSVIGLSWRGNAASWNVWLRKKGVAAWTKVAVATSPEWCIESGLVIGATYEVAVSIGAAAAGEQTSLTLRGKLDPPNDVQNFRAVAQGDEIIMDWDHIPDADLWGYEIRMGVDWKTAIIIAKGVSENSAVWGPPMDGTYRLWIKAVDQSGIYSINPAMAQVTIDISAVLNIVWQREELSGGVARAELDRLAAVNGGRELLWIPSLTDADFPPAYTDQDIAYYCGDTEPGSYTSQVYDLGAVTPFGLRLWAEYAAVAPGATDLTFPGRTDMTYPDDTDLSVSSLSVCQIEYRLSDDGTAWSDWAVWVAAQDVTARYLQVRVSTVLDSTDVRFSITRIASLADVPEQIKIFKASIAAAGTRFTMAQLGLRPMLMEYHVGVTVLGSAALYPVVAEEAQAFTVRCFDALGAPHVAQVSIGVRGF